MTSLRRIAILGTPLALMLFIASSAIANDRDLLYTKRAAAPDIMILVANTESMAGCEPNDTALPNGQQCTSLTTGFGSYLAPFGIGDSPFSKMGKAKSAILSMIEGNSGGFYFGLSSESYTRQTAQTGTTKRYTFVANQGSFCDGSTGGQYWACQPVGTALNFGPVLGTATTTTYGTVSYTVVPIGGLPSGSSTYVAPGSNTMPSSGTTNLGNETWIQAFGGDANHQPYLVNDSTHGMIITNPTGNTTAAAGTASKQEMVITFAAATNPSTSGDPYRIHQCSTSTDSRGCTLGDSHFNGQTFTVTKKIVDCSGSGGSVTGVTMTTDGTGYTSAPTVAFSGGGGTGAQGTANISEAVTSVTVSNGGSGYTSAPTVTFTGGGCTSSCATGTANISGPISSVVVTSGGSNYTSAPTVSFSGGGSGATGTAVISGSVASLTLTSGGSGYTSTPTCTLVGGGFTTQATCKVTKVSGKKVTGISITSAGAGYTSVPTVSFTGGGGSGAAATATIAASVVSVTVTNGGSGYTSPTVSFSGGGGSGAVATASVSGSVGSVTLTSGGSGYTSAPTVSFSGGSGSGAAGTATVSGSVVSVTITNVGSGYSSAPTVSFSGGGGSGAAGTATGSFGGSFSYPCNPSSGIVESTVTVDYVVPPLTDTNASITNLLTYCSEDTSTCTYPMVYSTFDHSTNAVAGEETGWIYYGDATVSGNQSGWITQSNSDQQPVVMIPHAYTPFATNSRSIPLSGTVNYTESSNPCIQRSFRPLSAIIDNSSSHTQSDGYPIFTPVTGQTDGSTNLSSTECDKMVDGLWQTGNFPNGGTNEIAPVIFPAGHNGSGIDLVKMLKNTYQYFNGGNSGCSAAGGGVDGFCGGIRPDDPFEACRQSAVILITDSFTGSSPDFKFGNSQDPTSLLKAINVPVFVIGYAMALNSSGSCSLSSLPDGTTNLNYGQCIAYYSGATTFQGTSVTRQGYYQVESAADLSAALTAVLNNLKTTTRDFATATIPSVSATSAGIAYLSQFNPKNNRSVWQGHLRAYFLDPSTGLVQAVSQTDPKPSPTAFSFWTGTTPATGSLIWDGGGTGSDAPGIDGVLDGIRNVDPTLLLTSAPGASGTWSADNSAHTSGHDQMTSYPSGGIGRNVFFGLKPGDTGCTSSTWECLAQVPVGSGGTSPTPTNTSEPATGWVVPSAPSTKPTIAGNSSSWWDTAKGSSYVNLPSSTLEGDADQALQNSFSFLRGNRDPVVEAFKLATDKFDTNHTTCASLSSDSDSPCYYGDIMGDLFHSNPTIVSAPGNFRYYFAQDPNTASAGTYSDRGASYQTFYSDHAHRRKILYVGGNDGTLHAFDVGVYNGDQSTYTPNDPNKSVCPLCGKYDFGSGREIFAYAPRAGLNKIYDLAHTIDYNWTIDGPPSVDDVYIDVTRVGGNAQGVAPSGSTSDSDITGASPASSSHSWRTVLVGTEREGGMPGSDKTGLSSTGGGIASGVSGYGGSIFALDVTGPDETNNMKSSDVGGHTGVPQCIVANWDPGSASGNTGLDVNCLDGAGNPAPYPRILWEIRDDQSTTTTSPDPTELSTSTDATTQDLGMTWSQPVMGRVKITTGGSPRDFFVAIFGGGYDHAGTTLSDTNTSGNTGNFLYMVDIETGKIIYKKNLGPWSTGASGSSTAGNLTAGVPGAPAVIDINNDGYLDTIYIGDTQGRLWKVDLTATATMSSSNRVLSTDWNPELFFDEYLNTTAQGTNPRQPIFDRPAAFFVGNTSTGSPQIGIAFGTGDRDNMPVSTDTNQNMFIVVTDPPGRATPVSNDAPLTLADLTLASISTNNCTSSNCLNANGYFLNLPVGTSGAQIVNTDPLVFNQQIFFNTFLHSTTAGNCNETGVPFIYAIDFATGVGTATEVTTGSEVLSTDIIYSAGGGANATATNTTDTGAKVNVTASGDDTSQQDVKTGLTPTVKIKSWKEE